MLYNLTLSSSPRHCDWAHNLWCVSGGPLLCAASEFRLRARSRGAAGGGIESPPEKINNALVCKWPVLTPRLSRRLELLWPLDRSRQVVSGRNTFPQMTSLRRESEAQSEPGTKAQYSIKTWDHILIFFSFLFFSPPNKFCCMIVSSRTFCLLSAASLTDWDPD